MFLWTVLLLCVFRYGETHPMFFIGSLEAASQEAFYGKARDVSKLMGLMDKSNLQRDCNSCQKHTYHVALIFQTSSSDNG